MPFQSMIGAEKKFKLNLSNKVNRLVIEHITTYFSIIIVLNHSTMTGLIKVC